MPDEEEGHQGELEHLVDETLLVDALMGWDGDPCGCPCRCGRFRDDAKELLCLECRQGEHRTPIDSGGR